MQLHHTGCSERCDTQTCVWGAIGVRQPHSTSVHMEELHSDRMQRDVMPSWSFEAFRTKSVVHGLFCQNTHVFCVSAEIIPGVPHAELMLT